MWRSIIEAEFLFRFVDLALYEGGEMIIELQRYLVIRRTAKGAWINRNPTIMGFGIDRYGKARFVLDGEGKRFAHATQEQAMASFIRRKERQIGHLENQLIFARAALKGVQAPGFKPDLPFYDETLTPFHSY